MAFFVRLLGICGFTSTIIAMTWGAQTESVAQVPNPVQLNTGCDTGGAEFAQSTSSTSPEPRRIDPISNREFMSFSIDEVDDADGGEMSCWKRLDGVWQELSPIALDTSFTAEGWAAESAALASLAHGVYTRPNLIVIESENQGDSLLVQFPLTGEPPIEYVDDDGVPLDEVLIRGGLIKVFRTRDRSVRREFREMELDVTRTGYVRLRFGRMTFHRPQPGTARSEWSDQISAQDPFMIGFTMENISANRKGYDVITQDPQRFLQNPKAEVFAHARQGYVIDEKRIVPLGLKLIKEDVQGATYFTRAISSEQEYQSANRSAYGYGLSVSSPFQVDGVEIGDIGFSYGYENSRESFQSLSSSQHVSEEIGSMRYKKYALVLDPAYTTLSDRFIDAVDDAVRYGDYRQIIETFGTHYPYAITYGAAGNVSQYVTKEAFARAYGSSADRKREDNLSLAVLNINEMKSSGSSRSSSFSETNEYGERSFSAVGGNGSWNEAGFVAGEAHYPILADLRPLDELLNEVNFPGEPDVYVQARQGLARAIEEYLYAHSVLSADTLFSDLEDVPLVSGCWSFVDQTGVRRKNVIEELSEDTIVAYRHGDPKRFEYYFSRDRTYRAAKGNATYYFRSPDTAIWSSPTVPNPMRLTRIGDFC